MTNQLSKQTRGRLYTRALELGGRPSFDSIITHALDIEDRLKSCLAVHEEAEDKCVTIAEIFAILQR